jgi:hypothetical protein
MKKHKLTGQNLAEAYAITFRHLGRVWAYYEDGGWIVLRGEGLPPHPDLKELYPNGWSLMSRVRSSEARERIRESL